MCFGSQCQTVNANPLNYSFDNGCKAQAVGSILQKVQKISSWDHSKTNALDAVHVDLEYEDFALFI